MSQFLFPRESKERKTMLLAIVVFALIAVICLASFAAPLLNSHLLVWNRNDEVKAPRLLKPLEVRLEDLPSLVDAMSLGSREVRYAGLTFNTPDRPSEEDSVNLNLSVENGKLGFDWVLLAPRNLQDAESFTAFARAQGVEPIAHSMNGVSYLRVERVDVAKFAASIVTDIYKRPLTEPLQLVHEGFAWPLN